MTNQNQPPRSRAMQTAPAQGLSADLAAWGDFDPAAAADQVQGLKEHRFSGGRMLEKLVEGVTTLRILPPRPDSGMKTPFRVCYEHFIDVPGVGKVSFYCPRLESGGQERCPACEESAKLMASRAKFDQERGKKIKANAKFLANVLVRGKENDGPKVWKGGSNQMETMLGWLLKMRVNFVHPTRGQDVLVDRTGTELETRYALSLNHEGPSPICEDQAQAMQWLEGTHDLDGVVELLTYQEILDKLAGVKPRDARPGTTRPALGGGAPAQGGAGYGQRGFGGGAPATARPAARGPAQPPPVDAEFEDEFGSDPGGDDDTPF